MAGRTKADTKRRLGQFFTAVNPFDHPAFERWAANLPSSAKGVEPFAGENALVHMAVNVGLTLPFDSFDVSPASPDVSKRDTLKSFPTGYDVCITNPPYLAKNAATRLGVSTRQMRGFDNLWKLSMSLCLEHCRFVAAIIPESFLTSGLFQDRLEGVVSLPYRMFEDTEQPVCLALWGPNLNPRYDIYLGSRRLGTNTALRARVNRLLPHSDPVPVIFNVPSGNIGLRAVDGHQSPSIAFVEPDEIPASSVKPTSRHLTRIQFDGIDKAQKVIQRANEILAQYRDITNDVFLTSFRGQMETGGFRRRLDWQTSRRILWAAAS